MKRWEEYVEDPFDDTRHENPINDFLQGPPILRSEIEGALKQMSTGKACGIDDISTEALKAMGDFGLDKLTSLCNQMYKNAYIPEDLRTSVFIVLPKKANAIECSDHRTISLMCHTLKLLLTVILRRISTKIDAVVSDEQTGFRKNSGTREGIFSLRMLVEKHIEMQRDIYACFIDYSKAFDTVNHAKLIECLQNCTDIDGNDIAVITNLYWHQITQIRIQDTVSDPLKIKRGVRQGCVLSPCLFNLYTEIIFREVAEMPGLRVGGRIINNIRYADDTVLLAESENDLQTLVDIIKTKSENYGLLMNVKKTKTMVFSKKETVPSVNITINNNMVEQVKSFTYLGQLVTEDGRCEKEVRRRIGIAKSAFAKYNSILTSRQISFATRIRFAQCYIWSTLLYGCETWTLTKPLERHIAAFELWLYRRMARIPWTDKITNREVLIRVGKGKTELLRRLKRQRMTYYGHIRRHDSMQKTILEGRVDGKRGAGRRR